MKKKIVLGIGLLFLGLLVWYFFLKPYDYLVTFRAKTIPGTVHQSIKFWSNAKQNATILDWENTNSLTQQVQQGDSTHIYRWKLKL